MNDFNIVNEDCNQDEKTISKLGLVQKVGSVFLIKSVGAGLTFSSHLILAKVLNGQLYGDYMYSMAMLTVIATLSRLGMDGVLLRFIPLYIAHNNWNSLTKLIDKTRSWVLNFSLVLSIFFLILNLLNKQIDPSLSSIFFCACLILPILSLTAIQQTIIQAVGKVAHSQIPELIIRPLILIILIFISSYVTNRSLSNWEIMILTIISIVISYLYSFCYLKKIFKTQTQDLSIPNIATSNLWLKTGLTLLTGSLFSVSLTQADIFFLGFYKGTEVTGIYIMVVKISSLILFGISSVNSVISPLISEIYSSGNLKKLRKLLTTSSIICVVLSVPIFILSIYFSRQFLDWIGEGFSKGYLPLMILILGQLFNAALGPVGLVLNMTGNQDCVTKILGGVSIFHLAVCTILIPTFGMDGAAISTTLSILLWNSLMAMNVKNKIFNPNYIA